MALLNLNKNISPKNMFKSKYLLKPLVMIVVLQMILMPVVPVLADEIQLLDIENAATTNEVVDNLIPVVSTTEKTDPVENVIVPAQGLFNDLLTNINVSLPNSETTTIVVENVSSTLETVIDLPTSSLVTSDTSVSVPTTSVVVSTSTISSSTILTSPTNTIKYDIFLLDELNDREEEGMIPIRIKSEPMPDDSLFLVVDEFKDEADLGGGRKALKIYSSPRSIYSEDGIKKIRPIGWSKFTEDPVSKIKESKNSGYSFGIPFSGDKKVDITSGDMEQRKEGRQINRIAPDKPSFKNKLDKNQRMVSSFDNIFDGIDVNFIDKQNSRTKEIIINKQPANISPETEVIFWENYSVPNDAKIIIGDSEYTREIRTYSPTTIVLENKESMLIDASIIYDSQNKDDSYCDMSQKPVEQIVNFDKENSVLKIGLVVKGEYLLDKERVYPVIVDPSYYTCTGTSCVTDFYLQYLTGKTTLTDSYLFIGYDYASGVSPCTPAGYASRHSVFQFNVSAIPAGSVVTDSKLNLKYTGIGCGEYNSYINLEPKRITSPWTYSNITYNSIRTSLTTGGTAKSLSYTNLASDCPGGVCTWDLYDSMVQTWVNSPSSNYGFLVEPAGSFSSGSVPPTAWSNQQRLFKFYSSDFSAANSPYLYITYNSPAPVYPDLTDNSTTVSPNPVTVGQNLTINFKVKNSSTAASVSQSSVLKYYFNPSGSCNSTANLAGQITVPTLGASGTNSQTANYVIPSGLAAGSYCLNYVIDSNNSVIESNEGNNAFQIPVVVNLPAKPDLTRTSDSLNKYNFILGESINAGVGVINQGTASAASTYVNFYFTQNSCGYSNLVGQSYLTSLGASTQTSINYSYAIPASTSVGTYYLSYTIDGPGNISESNESNNQYCFGAISVSGQPDFTPSSFTINDTKLRYSGLSDTVVVNGRIRNLGNVGNSSVGYSLRLKSLTDGLTYNLTNLSPGTLNLSAGYDQYINLTGSVPSNMPYYANYTVEIILDSGAAIVESNESNNTNATSNNVAVQQYNTGGGTTSDVDKDTYTNVEEIFAGTNPNGTQSLNIYSTNYKTKKATLADQPKSLVSSYSSDAMSSINMAYMFGNPSYAADPVNIRTGAFEFTQTDFALAGRGLPITFGLTYNSKVSDIDNRTGNGWSDSYNIFYYQDPTTKNIQLYLGGAVATLFTTTDGGITFTSPVGESETLTKESGNLVYKTLEGKKFVFSLLQTNNLGVLKQIIDTKGNTVTLNYNTVRDVLLISSIVDASGRQINFTYPASTDLLWDKIQEVRETVGGSSKLIAKYTYDSNKNLIKAHQESNYSVEVIKNIDRNFTYDASGRMLTYTDPRGTILYNEYDASGRITKQWEHNPRLGVGDKRLVYDLTYTDVPDANVVGSAHCTLVKNYRDSINHYDEYACYNSNELKIYSKKGNNIEKWEYNSAGMATKYTDALNNATNYSFDAKRRLISQALADSTDWRTVITFEYENNFNRLIKKTEMITALTGKIPTAPRVTSYTIDPANGNIAAIQYPDGISESFQYDVYGNIKKHTNKNNAVTDYVYDANGNYLISETLSVTQADSTVQIIKKQYGYDAYGHRTSYVDPNNKTYSYSYDSRGNLRVETDPLSNSKYYKYDVEDHKISDIDSLGHEIQYVFDTDINASLLSVTKLSNSGNITNSRQYDYVGNLVKEIDGNGNVKNYSYTAENWLLSTMDVKRTITSEYFANGWLKKQTDNEGRRTDYFYDSLGNKTETRAFYDSANFIANKFVYDGFNRVVSQTDGKNNVTTFGYDVLDRLTAQTDTKGGVITYFYDAVGNKIGERSPRASADVALRNSYGYSTAYFYDNANRLIKMVNADNKATLYIYDANGNILKSVENQNSDGTSATHVSQATYFDNNWKKTETDANGGVVQYTYEKVGVVKTKTSAAGLVTTYTYDDFNRLTKETDNVGLAINYQYDANNNKTAVIYPDTTKTQYTYNALDQLITVKDALNGTRQFEYDGDNNKTKEINKLGKATNFSYDKLNRLSQEINPAGTATNYNYDNNSNRTAETVGAKTTAYEYDELNRNTKITYPGNKSESFTYDANGNITTKTDGKGQKITYTSDKLNRQTSKLLPGGFSVQYGYDNWGNITNLTDESGTTQYVYDNLNRNTAETKTFVGLTGKNYVIVRAYNADSQLSAITDGASRKFDYSYNTRGLLDNVKLDATILAKYTYSNFGKPSLVEYGNGIKTNLTYDSLNRVTNIATNSGTTTLFSQKYTYDAQSNRITMNEGTSNTTTYSYDDLEQLINVNINNNGTSSALGYAYDIYGNRIVQSNPLGSASYVYTTNTNELDKVTYNNRLSVASLFDGNGSLTKETYTKLNKTDKEITYSWDSQNRLTQINYKYSSRPFFMPAVPDNALNFTYDDAGNRTKKQTTHGTLTYYLNTGNTVLNEIGSTGTTTRSIVYGLSQIAEIDQNNAITYIHQDNLGSTVLTTDQTGVTVTKYEYDPFGQIIGQDGFTNTNYLYTNQEYDQESELYYYNARYYNPRLGRFIARDPVLGRDGDSLSQNGYTYVNNNPLKYVDPTGKFLDVFLDAAFVAIDIGQTVWGGGQYIYGKVTDNQDLVSKGGNNFVEGGISLSLDAAATFVPGLTGTGVAYRANNVMKATDKAIDGYKAIDKGRELGKTAERLEDISQSGKKAIKVNGNVRYPDKMTRDSIVEVKGGTKIGNRDAGQIRDFVDYAKQTDKQVYVSGRKNLNVSKIQDLIDGGNVIKKDLGYMKGYEYGKTIRDGIIISNPIRYYNMFNNNDSYTENMSYSDNK